MNQLTREQAIAFAEAETWRSMSEIERAAFQLEQDCLCMPFDEFHRCVEIALGRPVWTHELGLNRDGLKAEMEGRKGRPPLSEILALLPAEKTVIVLLEDGAETGGET